MMHLAAARLNDHNSLLNACLHICERELAARVDLIKGVGEEVQDASFYWSPTLE